MVHCFLVFPLTSLSMATGVVVGVWAMWAYDTDFKYSYAIVFLVITTGYFLIAYEYRILPAAYRYVGKRFFSDSTKNVLMDGTAIVLYIFQ